MTQLQSHPDSNDFSDGLNGPGPVHLIINPHSGYGGNRRVLGEFRAAAKQNELELINYTTRAPADATRYARSISAEARAVVVWGGDGTVSEVAGGLAGTNVPILPCPAGTENLLAKELHIPTSPHKIIQLLRDAAVVSCDVGSINGRVFLLIIGVGFDGEVVQRLTAGRTGHISHLDYFWPIWRTFWEHRFPRIHAVADGEEIFDGTGMAFIGNISRYATGLRICHDARFDDGMLDLVILSCRNQWSLAAHAARIAVKRNRDRTNVLYRRFKHLRIDSDSPIPCQIDGDAGPNTPVDISVAPAGVKLIVPRHRRRNRLLGILKRNHRE